MTFNRGLFIATDEDEGNDERETPFELFDALDKEFGGFLLDAAATEANALCHDYYTKETNGLAQPWASRTWCNPPYGHVLRYWLKKGYEESRKGNIVVMLLPARTDTVWWHKYVMRAYEVRFIRGQLRFSQSPNSAPFPSCIVVFQPEPFRRPGPLFYSADKCGRVIACLNDSCER